MLHPDQINHLNSPTTHKEIKTFIRSLRTTITTGTISFSAELYQIFKDDLIPILFKLFHKKRNRSNTVLLLWSNIYTEPWRTFIHSTLQMKDILWNWKLIRISFHRDHHKIFFYFFHVKCDKCILKSGWVLIKFNFRRYHVHLRGI